MGGAVWSKLATWKASNEAKWAAVNHAAHVLTFWLPSLALFWIRRNKLFTRYKIQKDEEPPAALVAEALKHVTKNTLIIPFVSVFFYRLLAAGGKRAVRAGKGGGGEGAADEADEAEAAKAGKVGKVGEAAGAEHGWAAVRFLGALPAWSTTLWQVAVAYLGYDAMFYWSHRYLHLKESAVGGYAAVHKMHHKFYVPVGISANYEHTVEGAMQLLNWYLPLGLAGWLNRGRGGLHVSTAFWYNALRWIETIDAHCGYDFPWSPFSLIPLFGGALSHDYHHSMVFGNFGATVIWDRLCGTELPAFKKLRLKGKLRDGLR